MTVRTQTRYPTTVVSDDAVGTLAWTNPDKAEVEDNDPATATGPGISEWLKCTGYGFNLPSDAEPQTIAILPRRRVTGATPPTYEGHGARANGSGGAGTTAVSIPVPDDVVEGELLLAEVCVSNSTQSSPSIVADEDGWTVVVTSAMTGAFTPWARGAIYRRIATANEPESYGFTGTVTSSASMRGRIVRVSGVDPDSPVDASSMTTAPGATSHTAPSITTTGANRLVLTFFCNLSSATATWSTPGSTTEEVDAQGGAVFSYVQPSASSTGTRASTASTGVNAFRAQVAIVGLPTASDDDVRLVVDDAIEGDSLDGGLSWSSTFATDTAAEADISEVTVADINASDFGCALSASVGSGSVAEVDAVALRVTYDIAVDVAITAPTADLTQHQPTVTWDAEVNGTPITQASYIVRIRARPSLAVLYDSGVVAGATQAHVVGSGTPSTPWATPQNGQAIRIEVTVTEDGTADPDGTGDPISGSATFDCTTDWTLPTAPTGLAAVAVTEEV